MLQPFLDGDQCPDGGIRRWCQPLGEQLRVQIQLPAAQTASLGGTYVKALVLDMQLVPGLDGHWNRVGRDSGCYRRGVAATLWVRARRGPLSANGTRRQLPAIAGQPVIYASSPRWALSDGSECRASYQQLSLLLQLAADQ